MLAPSHFPLVFSPLEFLALWAPFIPSISQRVCGALVRVLRTLALVFAPALFLSHTAAAAIDWSKLPAKKIAALMQSAQEPLSLDALLGEGEETPLGDLLLDLAAPDPEHSTIRARNREALEDILAVLRPRDVVNLHVARGRNIVLSIFADVI